MSYSALPFTVFLLNCHLFFKNNFKFILMCFQMTKKCSQLLTLEKQLEEKIVAYSSIAAKNAELEQELMVKITSFCYKFTLSLRNLICNSMFVLV